MCVVLILHKCGNISLRVVWLNICGMYPSCASVRLKKTIEITLWTIEEATTMALLFAAVTSI